MYLGLRTTCPYISAAQFRRKRSATLDVIRTLLAGCSASSKARSNSPSHQLLLRPRGSDVGSKAGLLSERTRL
jgi:hypothetical protein